MDKKVYHKPMMADMTEYEMRTTSGGGIVAPFVVVAVVGIAIYAAVASAGVVWNAIYAASAVVK